MDPIADLSYPNYRDFRDPATDRGPVLPAVDDWIYPSYAQLNPFPHKAMLPSSRPPDQSYPSPSPSVPSPGPGSASGTSTPPDEMFARESQLGPVRHPRTRQLSLSYGGRTHARRHSAADSQSGGECDPDDISRPQSPYSFDHSDLPLHPANGLSLTIPNAMDGSPYQPATPASLSSSPYSYDDYRATLDARPPSPASSRDQSLDYNTSVYDDAAYQPPKGRTRGPIRKHTKKKLDGSEKKRICQYHLDHQNARQEDIAEMFGIERSTVSKILKLKAHWLNVDDEPSKFPVIENDMVSWLRECLSNSTPIHDSGIRKQALLIAKQHDIGEDRFKASSGWIENFKHRHNIRSGKWIGSKYEFMGSFEDGVPAPNNIHEFANPGLNGHGPVQSLKLPVIPNPNSANGNNPYRAGSSGSPSSSSRSSSSESLVRDTLMAGTADSPSASGDPIKDGDPDDAPTSTHPQPQEPLWSASSTAPMASSSAHHTERVLPPPHSSSHYDSRSSSHYYASASSAYPSHPSDDVYMRPPAPALGSSEMVVHSLVQRSPVEKKFTLDEAEQALDVVTHFLLQKLHEGHVIVGREHREVLRHIAVQINEWGSGLPRNTPP